MKVQTKADTIDVRTGTQFVERRTRPKFRPEIKFFEMFEVFEVVSEPEVIIQASGSKFIQWKGRSLKLEK